MDYFSAPLLLQSGVTISVAAWHYTQFAARYMDYRNLLRTYADFSDARQEDASASRTQQLLLDRVIQAAVPSEEDRKEISAADLPDLIDVVFELNRLEEVASKPARLSTRLHQAESKRESRPRPIQSLT